MERLTFVDEDGKVLFDNPAGFPEDVGFTIRELAKNEEWEALDNIAQRLANCEQRLKCYKDLEEQNRLLELPCKAGQKVFLLRKDIKIIIDGEITSIRIGEFASDMKIFMIDDNRYTDASFDKIGDIVFFTKEEAEAALEELERGKGE